MSIIFETTPEQRVELLELMWAMARGGLSRYLVSVAYQIACRDAGVFDLMKLWCDAGEADKAAIESDIKKSVIDYL